MINISAKIIGILSLVIISIIGLVYYALVSLPCSFDQNDATEKVKSYLKEKGLPLEYLVAEQIDEAECEFSYIYKGAGENIHFVVIDDFVRGAKLMYWDYNKRDN